MATTWKCGECETVNSVDRAVCMCGEERPASATPATEFGGKGSCCSPGCPMPGTFTASTRGSDHWWCLWHWDYRGDPRHCQRITQDLIVNRPPMRGAKASGEFINTFKKTEKAASV